VSDSDGETITASSAGGIVQGFLTGISNPKDILFFVSLFPQFIAITSDFNTSILTLSIIWGIFDFSILSLYILLVKKWLPEKHKKRMEIVSSLFLLLVAIGGAIYNVYAVFG
jgi:threonine/homoserine/homoserine lactone efflux protein